MGIQRRLGPSVVVPAVAVPSTVATIRSLSRAGVHTIVVSEDPHPGAYSSAYCDEAVAVPDPASDLDGYANALLALARREDVRTIVPAREEDAFVLSKYREAFAAHVATPWPSLETLERVTDRVELAAAAEAAGAPMPETRPIGDVDVVRSPSVVKSRYNLLVQDYVDTVPPGQTSQAGTIRYLEPGTRPNVEAYRKEFGHEPIIQEFVPVTEEYMFGGLYDRGEPVATFQHRQVRGESYAHGGGVYRESVYIPELERAARAILDHLDWHGLACIEYMRDPATGEFKLAEINPRMWRSLSANVNMGADFPLYYWQLATGEADRIDDDYDIGVGSHHLMGELGFLLSILTDDSPFVDRPSMLEAMGQIAVSFVRHPTFDLLSRDDPWPFVHDVIDALAVVAPVETVPDWLSSLGIERAPVDWREASELSVGDDSGGSEPYPTVGTPSAPAHDAHRPKEV